MKYRKKPVVIEAVRLMENRDSIIEAINFINGFTDNTADEIKKYTYSNSVFDNGGIDIKTLEGTMHASFGDFIIKGINGEFYPCKPDIFEKTYEIMEEL